MIKKILFIIQALLVLFCSSNIFYAKDNNEIILPEYTSKITDFSKIDEKFHIDYYNGYKNENELSLSENKNESINSNKITSYPTLRSGYDSVYSADGYESNNSFSSASDFGILVSDYNLGVYTSGSIHDIGPNYLTDINDRDVDYYEFEIQEPYYFEIDITDIPSGCDYDIVLYRKKTVLFIPSYVEVGSSLRASNSDELINTYSDTSNNEYYDYLPEGTYIIKVYSYSGCSNLEYYLHIGFDGLDDDYEINDTKNNSYYLSLPYSATYSTSIQATIDKNDDVDWYEISSNFVNTVVNITLHSPASNYKYYLELYAESSLITTRYSSNVIDDTYSTIQLMPNTSYYIRVYSLNSTKHSTKFKYTLSLSGTNSNVAYNFQNTDGSWKQYGIVWEYDASASTNNGYTAKKHYSSSEPYLYLTRKIYLYNFNASEIDEARISYLNVLAGIEGDPDFLHSFAEDVFYDIGEGTTSYFALHLINNNPPTWLITLGFTSYKIMSEETMNQYTKNLYNFIFNNLDVVAGDVDNYRLEIEEYSRVGSNDKYYYLIFTDANDIYAPPFFPDSVYPGEVVYGSLYYIDSSDHRDFMLQILNPNLYFKNNFQY